MSTYLDKAVNPNTNKLQLALFIDDYYGSHQYGVGFKKYGSDPSLYDEIDVNKYTIYPLEEITVKQYRLVKEVST